VGKVEEGGSCSNFVSLERVQLSMVVLLLFRCGGECGYRFDTWHTKFLVVGPTNF
jgi:hypothetical protein